MLNAAYPESLFSRKDLQQIVGVPDDVLGYWLKERLLVSEPTEGRKHRRFRFDQVHMAAVLNAMRSLGANVSVLRAFGDLMQHGARLFHDNPSIESRTFRQIAHLTSNRLLFERGEEVSVWTVEWEEWLYAAPPSTRLQDFTGESHRAATSVEDIERSAVGAESEFDLRPYVEFARSLSDKDVRAIYAYSDLVSEDHIQRLDSNDVWLCWLNEGGEADFLSGDDGNFPWRPARPVAGFYISISMLIQRAWGYTPRHVR